MPSSVTVRSNAWLLARHHRPGAVGRHFRPTQVVGVEHRQHAVAHQRHRLAARQAQVVRPHVRGPGVLRFHLATGTIGEPERRPAAAAGPLPGALAQRVDPVVVRPCAVHRPGQPVERGVAVGVAAAGQGVAVGVVGDGAAAQRGQTVAVGVDHVRQRRRQRVAALAADAGPVAVGVVDPRGVVVAGAHPGVPGQPAQQVVGVAQLAVRIADLAEPALPLLQASNANVCTCPPRYGDRRYKYC